MQYADLLEVLTEFYTGPGEVAAFNHTDPNKRSDAGLDAPTVKVDAQMHRCIDA
jgi:hypothetical protein